MEKMFIKLDDAYVDAHQIAAVLPHEEGATVLMHSGAKISHTEGPDKIIEKMIEAQRKLLRGEGML